MDKAEIGVSDTVDRTQRNLIIERTHAGLDAAHAQGKFGGRPPALDRRKKKLIDAAVTEAKRKGETSSSKEIAFAVGTSERTVRRYIRGEHSQSRPVCGRD